MASGFFRKVFSFGNPEIEQRPAEDEPLARLNFDALKAFAAENAVEKAAVETVPVAETAPVEVLTKAPVEPEPIPDEPLAEAPVVEALDPSLGGGRWIDEVDPGGVIDDEPDVEAPLSPFLTGRGYG